VFNFLPSKFHGVAHCSCRPRQDVVFEDKAVSKGIRISRPPRCFEMPIEERTISARTKQKKRMSSLCRHDNDCNTGDVVPVPQTTDPTLTNVDMADPTVQTTVLNHPPPPRSKQIRLRWMSTAPMAKTLGKQARNCTQTLVLHLQRSTYHQQVLDSYATHFGISLNFQKESLFSNLVESSPVSCQPGSLISNFI
jgi:hypothetical protein